MALTLYEFAKPDSAADVQRYIDRALRAAARIGAQLA
jgi:hypothetical protein